MMKRMRTKIQIELRTDEVRALLGIIEIFNEAAKDAEHLKPLKQFCESLTRRVTVQAEILERELRMQQQFDKTRRTRLGDSLGERKVTPKVHLRKRSAYGRELIDPMCATSGFFAQIAGRKTLTEADLAVIRNLGYEIIWDDPKEAL